MPRSPGSPSSSKRPPDAGLAASRDSQAIAPAPLRSASAGPGVRFPLHYQVYLSLRSAFDAGRWKPDDLLPSEVELARRQGCSLITVRHALAELAREGRVKRVPGRGTFVQAPPIERDLATIRSFTEEMHRRGWDHETRLIGAREESADLAVAEALRLPIGAPVLHLERVRLAAGAPLLLEHVYLSKDRYEGILAEDLERSSLYELLASRFGIQLIRAHETIEPVLPSRRDARLLGQSSRQPALLLEGTTYTYNDVPVEYCRALVRGDRARYHVEAGGLRCDAVVPSENGQGVTW